MEPVFESRIARSATMPASADFQRLWADLTLPANSVAGPESVFRDLALRYNEPHRRYHNFLHIDICLQHWADELAAGRWQQPALAAAAIWFHDSIYDTHATDNEEQSAALADRLLPLEPARRAIVHELILDTHHRTPPRSADGRLFVDIDLAGIGGSSADFAEGCRQIREEFSWVPAPVYREKRSQFLQSLLQRSAIYYTIPYRDRFEVAARRNLQEELDRLQHL